MAFQNPAQNFAEQRLNLGDLVTLSPHSTFLVRSDSSYPEAGIMQGSVLAIDRAITPQHRHIIVAEVERQQPEQWREYFRERLTFYRNAALQFPRGNDPVYAKPEADK